MTYSTEVTRYIAASPGAIYRALLDPDAVRFWRVPDDMTARIHQFDASEGGTFHVSLSYAEPDRTGKTSGHTDAYHGRFVKLTPDHLVIEVLEFETDDPALQGEMHMATSLIPAGDGTEVRMLQELVPDAIPRADNELGMRMALDKLALLVENELQSGTEQFTVNDLSTLSSLVAEAWTDAADRDWSVPAGTLDWSCLHTADHAVDCVYAPAFFLASRRLDRYPDVGGDLTFGARATPALLVESLELATRVLIGVVATAADSSRAVIFRRPQVITAPPSDFPPRAALELIVHAHDVCTGLGVRFEPPADLCRRLREHTRPWPMWGMAFDELPATDDPWRDLLVASGRG